MKNYLVIGGSSGIGLQLVKSLLEQGHRVFASYNTHTIGVNHPQLITFQLDATAKEVQLDILPDSLDGMVYCPGAINLTPFSRTNPVSYTEDFELQVVGAIKCIQAALQNLKNADQGSVVLFSTVAVQQGFNFHSQVAVSKGALEGLTRSLAAEFAPAIRFNCIAPSLINTPLAEKLLNSDKKIESNAERHPLKRIGQPEDISSMAAFLLSPKSGWISGQVLAIDGGMSRIRN